MTTPATRRRARRVTAPPPGREQNRHTAVGYVRVSREEQVREGVSLEAQEQRLREYAAFTGLDLVHIYRDEGESGGTPLAGRPEGARLLRALGRGDVRNVLGVKLDRLFRDAVDCMQRVRDWDAAGVGLHLLDIGGQAIDTRSPTGRFFLHVIAAAAEMELNRIRERTRDALAHKKSRGDRLGTTPLGYVTPGEREPMEVDAAGMDTVRLILRLRGIAGDTFREIAAQLEAAGRRTARGRRWHPNTARRVWSMRTRYRVPFGSERGAPPAEDVEACPGCGARLGALHEGGCAGEECATCDRPLHGCSGHTDQAAKAKQRRRKMGLAEGVPRVTNTVV